MSSSFFKKLKGFLVKDEELFKKAEDYFNE